MGIRNYPIAELTKAIPYTCRATNITRANAYAEFWFDRKFENLTMNNVEDFNRSAASGQSDAKLYVMLNTGVGGAYIDKEKLQTGVHNRYGEFGHMTIHPHGRKCFVEKKAVLKRMCQQDGFRRSRIVRWMNFSASYSRKIRVLSRYSRNI